MRAQMKNKLDDFVYWLLEVCVPKIKQLLSCLPSPSSDALTLFVLLQTAPSVGSTPSAETSPRPLTVMPLTMLTAATTSINLCQNLNSPTKCYFKTHTSTHLVLLLEHLTGPNRFHLAKLCCDLEVVEQVGQRIGSKDF